VYKNVILNDISRCSMENKIAEYFYNYWRLLSLYSEFRMTSVLELAASVG